MGSHRWTETHTPADWKAHRERHTNMRTDRSTQGDRHEHADRKTDAWTRMAWPSEIRGMEKTMPKKAEKWEGNSRSGACLLRFTIVI